jgi:hypothetical protein
MLSNINLRGYEHLMDFLKYINLISILIMDLILSPEDLKRKVPEFVEEAKKNNLTMEQTLKILQKFFLGVECIDLKYALIILFKETKAYLDQFPYEIDPHLVSNYSIITPYEIKECLGKVYMDAKRRYVRQEIEVRMKKDISDDFKSIMKDLWLEDMHNAHKTYKKHTIANSVMESKLTKSYALDAENKLLHELSKIHRIRKWNCGCCVKNDLITAVSMWTKNRSLKGVENEREMFNVVKILNKNNYKECDLPNLKFVPDDIEKNAEMEKFHKEKIKSYEQAKC